MKGAGRFRSQGGLHGVEDGAMEQFQTLDAVFQATLQQLLQLLVIGGVKAYHQRAAAAVGHLQLTAQILHHFAALYVETGLLGTGMGVETGVDDGAVGFGGTGTHILRTL